MTDSTEDVCVDCVKAAMTVWHSFRYGCQGCAARAVARGPNFSASRKLGNQTRRYREELAMLGVTHESVLQAHAVDKVKGGEQ